MTDMTNTIFEYYEIENTVNEYRSVVSARYTTLEDCKNKLADCSNWYCSKGTGTIYHVWYTVESNVVTYHREEVFRGRGNK